MAAESKGLTTSSAIFMRGGAPRAHEVLPVKYEHNPAELELSCIPTAHIQCISRYAVKSECACEWDGWGRLSDEGLKSKTRPERGPWDRAAEAARTAVLKRNAFPGTERGVNANSEGHEGRWQTDRRVELGRSGRPGLKYRPCSRTGENSPHGNLGRAMETSASFEARYAPSPTRPIMWVRVPSYR
jgi:hypothetical protein